MDLFDNLFSNATVLDAIIAALFSFLCAVATSFMAAKHEMKKMQFTANREDRTAEMRAFQEVAKSVTKYIYDPLFDLREDALASIAVARTIKNGYVGDLLDELRITIAADDRKKAEQLLFDIYDNWIDQES